MCLFWSSSHAPVSLSWLPNNAADKGKFSMSDCLQMTSAFRFTFCFVGGQTLSHLFKRRVSSELNFPIQTQNCFFSLNVIDIISSEWHLTLTEPKTYRDRVFRKDFSVIKTKQTICILRYQIKKENQKYQFGKVPDMSETSTGSSIRSFSRFAPTRTD